LLGVTDGVSTRKIGRIKCTGSRSRARAHPVLVPANTALAVSLWGCRVSNKYLPTGRGKKPPRSREIAAIRLESPPPARELSSTHLYCFHELENLNIPGDALDPPLWKV
jgi:hypothetical protein